MPPLENQICANRLAIAVPAPAPVSVGHTLIVTRQARATWFDANQDEQKAVFELIAEVKSILDRRDPRPEGYRIAIDSGPVGGACTHLQVHVIPRHLDGPGKALPWMDMVREAPALSLGGLEDPFFEHVAPLWRRARRVSVLAAFVRQSGLAVLRPLVEEACQSEGFQFRIVAGDYLGITQPEALEQLRGWEALFDGRVQARVVETARLPEASASFHPKSWLFETPEGEVAYVGSSNVSRSALATGIEWNLRLEGRADPGGWRRIADGFEGWWGRSLVLTPDWLAAYRERAAGAGGAPPELRSDPPEPLPTPHRLQEEALTSLTESRRAGHGRALVVMATGLGKTLVAALDARAFARELGRMPRILILAHREELLEQAALTFQRAFQEAGHRPRLGWIAGPQSDLEGDLTFAMVQKLGRKNHLERLPPGAFDYVFVDEAHHSEADSYRRILDRLAPQFLLGVTATPERADGADLTGLFDDHIPFQAGLGLGIQEGLLAPFHYLGLKDDIDYQNIPWSNHRFDLAALAEAAATQRRMETLWEGWQSAPGTRTLVFCCSIGHATFTESWLRDRGVRVASVHSQPGSAPRSETLAALRSGHLDAICAVDLFNEGVDLPTVDRVVMLRPTESPVVFLQQLGRGLRRHAGKVKLQVLDFVGNHRVFLDRLRFLLSATDASFQSVGAWLQGGLLQLPPGCEVEVTLEAKDLLEAMLPRKRGEAGAVGAALLEQVFDAFVSERGLRPKAGELFRLGYDIEALRSAGRDWFSFLGERGWLTAAEQAAARQAKGWLVEVQTTALAKSYKMVTLEALLEAGALEVGMDVGDLADRALHIIRRSPELSEDLKGVKAIPDLWAVPASDWLQYWKTNPIHHWTNKGPDSWFSLVGGNFISRVPKVRGAAEPIASMTRELVDYRLAKYRARSREPLDGGLGFVAKVTWNQRDPILNLPKADSRPRGWVQARLPEGEVWNFSLQAHFCNVAHPAGESRNRLPELMHRWFGPDAGKPGTQYRVTFERDRDGWKVRPFAHLGGASGEPSRLSLPA